MDNILSFFQENKQFLIPVLMFSTVIIIGLLSYYFSKKIECFGSLKRLVKKV